METESGLKVGMEYLQSIWVQLYEISWNVSVDNSHIDEQAYDTTSELDKLMGEKIVKVTFINANDAHEYTFDSAYLPIKFVSSLALENARSAYGKTTVTITGLVDDYVPAYAVEGLEISVENNSEMTWTVDPPGAYILVLTGANGVYAEMSASFVLSTDILPMIWDADMGELATAEGCDEATKDAFIKNLATVTVNVKEYAAAGRGAAKTR